MVISTLHIKSRIDLRIFKASVYFINLGNGTKVKIPFAFEKAEVLMLLYFSLILVAKRIVDTICIDVN